MNLIVKTFVKFYPELATFRTSSAPKPVPMWVSSLHFKFTAINTKFHTYLSEHILTRSALRWSYIQWSPRSWLCNSEISNQDQPNWYPILCHGKGWIPCRCQPLAGRTNLNLDRRWKSCRVYHCLLRRWWSILWPLPDRVEDTIISSICFLGVLCTWLSGLRTWGCGSMLCHPVFIWLLLKRGTFGAAFYISFFLFPFLLLISNYKFSL